MKILLVPTSFLFGLVAGEEIKQALGRVGAETHLENLFRLSGLGRATGKEILLVGEERGFNVTGVGGDGLAEFGAVVHREVGTFAGRDHQVRTIMFFISWSIGRSRCMW